MMSFDESQNTEIYNYVGNVYITIPISCLVTTSSHRRGNLYVILVFGSGFIKNK